MLRIDSTEKTIVEDQQEIKLGPGADGTKSVSITISLNDDRWKGKQKGWTTDPKSREQSEQWRKTQECQGDVNKRNILVSSAGEKLSRAMVVTRSHARDLNAQVDINAPAHGSPLLAVDRPLSIQIDTETGKTVQSVVARQVGIDLNDIEDPEDGDGSDIEGSGASVSATA